jgi:hypothetical protein
VVFSFSSIRIHEISFYAAISTYFSYSLLTENLMIIPNFVELDIKLECGTYCTRNGKNGANIFIAKDGRISASRIAPVEVGLHSRVELSSECVELSPFY